MKFLLQIFNPVYLAQTPLLAVLAIGGLPPGSFARVTDAAETRLTETGDTRITE